MAKGKDIVELAARMSAADLSVIISAGYREVDEDFVLVTSQGSDNHRLWSMMAEKGWLEDRGDPKPDIPLPMASYALIYEKYKYPHTIASICYAGVVSGLTPEQILQLDDLEDPPELFRRALDRTY